MVRPEGGKEQNRILHGRIADHPARRHGDVRRDVQDRSPHRGLGGHCQSAHVLPSEREPAGRSSDATAFPSRPDGILVYGCANEERAYVPDVAEPHSGR